ncbi:hypothetical protein C6P40_003130 [Pichia californica]|uniref:Elongator complex protein 5 n=1 Tax=Pichia californica TaxID=460514 RepID=A0A9P6WGV5_9ASCO|nr:hypothetical protein C6P42_000209 [[Candida] californica]KAG0686940.1 hypothetical protein C6P40_003130 [[Candida] californica]
MSASVASPTILLNRIFSLREPCPFILVTDTFIQSATYLTDELITKARSSATDLSIIYLSFETTHTPSYIQTGRDQFINLLDKDFEIILTKTFQNDSSLNQISNTRKLIIIDSLNYIQPNKIISFLKLIMNPSHTVYGIYHQDMNFQLNQSKNPSPSAYTYLHYLSSCVFEVKPTDFNDSDSLYNQILSNGPVFPLGVKSTQQPLFFIELTYRRKSGRSLEYNFTIDSSTHNYEVITLENNTTDQDDETLLKDLTTFNLGTTRKQREQRDKVDLPFLEAQKSMGSVGSSIVYEFEKDDDYDEEDPFEDPF